MKIDKAIQIAYKVRKQCEVFVNSEASKNYDFHKQDDLGCMCAVASFTLAFTLNKRNIEAKMIRGKFFINNDAHKDEDEDCFGDEHCWVEFRDKIIDITATQFDDVPKVYVSNRDSNRYSGEQVVLEPSELEGWGEEQKPNPEATQKILAIKV